MTDDRPTSTGAFVYVAARPVVENVKQLRLHRDDFETLKIIGRGAFGEVRVGLRPCNCGSVNVGVGASVLQSHKNVSIFRKI